LHRPSLAPPTDLVLIFSGHLVHGLAVNENADLMGVALEFRLFKPHTNDAPGSSMRPNLPKVRHNASRSTRHISRSLHRE
jgi:hypothetical protein